MQLLSSLKRPATARDGGEVPAGKHLPYARHADDHTIETRDGLLLQVIRLRGILFETADSDELNYRKLLRDAMLQAIGSSRYALYHHVVRREASITLDGDFGDDFSAGLDDRWQARLATRQLYRNDLYLTLVRRPAPGRMGVLDRLSGWLGQTGQDYQAGLAQELRLLDTAREALIAQLGSYEPELLGLYDSDQGLCSEPLEFLGQLYSGEPRRLLAPHQDAGASSIVSAPKLIRRSGR